MANLIGLRRKRKKYFHDVDLCILVFLFEFTIRILEISKYRLFKSSKSTHFESSGQTGGTRPKPGKVLSKVNFSELGLFNFGLFFENF